MAQGKGGSVHMTVHDDRALLALQVDDAMLLCDHETVNI